MKKKPDGNGKDNVIDLSACFYERARMRPFTKEDIEALHDSLILAERLRREMRRSLFNFLYALSGALLGSLFFFYLIKKYI